MTIDQDELRFLWSAYYDGVNYSDGQKMHREHLYHGDARKLWERGRDGLPSDLPEVDNSDDPRRMYL